MNRAVLMLSLCCLVTSVAAAGEPITIGERLLIDSKVLDEQRTVLISTPPGYVHSQERYPVIYLLDGGTHLTHTRGTVDFLSGAGLMPQVIIVGITNTDRTRDLTPTRAGYPAENGRPAREYPTSGGGPRFLDFIDSELVPMIDSSYRTVPYRLLAGHSLGGLLALHAAIARPGMLDAVIAVSPSLRWDNELVTRSALKLVKEADGSESHGTDPRHGTIIFASMANEEEGDPRPNRLDRLEQALEHAGARGIRSKVMRFPDETHGSVVLRSHYWGLRMIFDSWRLPTTSASGAFTGSVAEVKQHYSALSRRLGLSIQPDLGTIARIGHRHLHHDELQEAIEAFAYGVELYPDSADASYTLAKALERAGRLEDALQSYSTAARCASRTNHPDQESIQSALDQLEKALADRSPG